MINIRNETKSENKQMIIENLLPSIFEVILYLGFTFFLIGMLLLTTSHIFNINPIYGLIIICSSIILQVGIIIIEPKYRKKEITHKMGNVIAIIVLIIQIIMASFAIYVIIL